MSKKIKQVIYIVCICIFLAIFLYSGYQILSYLKEAADSRKMVDELTDLAVILNEPPLKIEDPGTDKTGESVADQGTLEEPQESGAIENEGSGHVSEPKKETAPLEVDFELLLQTNADVRGWLYCADTIINYPVVQGEDNDYYLYRLVNGNHNSAGTLFMDCLNQEDFTDWNTLVYGHNMKNGSMFGTITRYIRQEYYDEHPIWYLMTPDADYRIDLIAGYITDTADEIYSFPGSMEDKNALVESFMKKSTFATNARIEPEDRLITFSTCTYEFEDARYVLIGVLKEIPK